MEPQLLGLDLSPAALETEPRSQTPGKHIETELQPIPSCCKLRQSHKLRVGLGNLVRPVSHEKGLGVWLSGRDPGFSP